MTLCRYILSVIMQTDILSVIMLHVSNAMLTGIEVDLELCHSAHPVRVLVGDVAPEVAAIRYPDVGDLQHSGRHHLHPVVEHQWLAKCYKTLFLFVI
jgi:hypothetical protein